MSGTEIEYGSISPRHVMYELEYGSTSLRALCHSTVVSAYAMCGTEIEYAAMGIGARCGMGGSEMGYGTSRGGGQGMGAVPV
eukprot:841532-Rhodomonas_salina.1